MQQDGCKTQDGRMTYKNVAQDRECTVSRHIFSSFCRPESYRRPVELGKLPILTILTDCERDMGAALPRVASSVAVGRRAKR